MLTVTIFKIGRDAGLGIALVGKYGPVAGFESHGFETRT